MPWRWGPRRRPWFLGFNPGIELVDHGLSLGRFRDEGILVNVALPPAVPILFHRNGRETKNLATTPAL
jgi:hypothetical protein